MVTRTNHPRARTVALVGRSGVGKTSLLEALMVAAGARERPGRVEDGTTLCGTDPEERRHHASLSIGTAVLRVGDDRLTLLDTPGLADFGGEVDRALDVADVVLFVVAAQGVPADTAAWWRRCRDAGVPAVVFVNALDAERADYESVLGELEALVGPTLAPLEIPLGVGSDAEGFVDLLRDEAFGFGPEGETPGTMPASLVDLEARARASLLEAIVVGDDEMTERYLDNQELAWDELEEVMGRLMSEGRIVPVTVGSALRGFGVRRLLTLLDEIAESRPISMVQAGEVVALARDPDAESVVRAFKVIVDPYVGRIVVAEVVSGRLAGDDTLTCTRTGHEERVHGLHQLVGTTMVPLDQAIAGDVVALTKLNDVQIGDVLVRGRRDLRPLAPAPATPALSMAVVGDDDDKLATALHRLAEEDPSLGLRHDRVARSLVVDAMGELHLQVIQERLRRRFNVAVSWAPPPVAHFETIRAATESEGRVKKQTGGHGQFAVVNILVEPIEPTAPWEFVDAVVGGAVPRQYIGAVRHGIERAMEHGGPSGHPVVGLRVTLRDGKSHSVDSSEAAFETAGSVALRAALEKAGTVLLERVMATEVRVPDWSLGDVLTDLASRRARVVGTRAADEGETVVSALVPEASLVRYGLDLRQSTGGQGRYEARVDHFAEAPVAVGRSSTNVG